MENFENFDLIGKALLVKSAMDAKPEEYHYLIERAGSIKKGTKSLKEDNYLHVILQEGEKNDPRGVIRRGQLSCLIDLFKQIVDENPGTGNKKGLVRYDQVYQTATRNPVIDTQYVVNKVLS